jgi:glycosyltransferase involved in cell wall biosynthesis
MVGPSREEVCTNLGPEAGLLDTLNDSLRFAGRLPHREALQRLARADFSILLRPDARFAHAGFPTKLVESLTMLYVRDGHEGIVVKDCSPEAFAEGLRRALALSSEDRAAMRRDARNCAEESFDYHNWVKPLGEFMDTVVAHSSHNK